LAGQLVVLRIVGVSPESDAYIAAQALPQVILAVIAASLQSLWLPRFARLSKDPMGLRAELSIAQGQTFKILMGLTVPIWLGSFLWVPWAFPGFAPDQLNQVVALSGPLLAAGVLNAHSGILTAGMRANGRFLRAEVAALLGSIASIALYAIFVPRHGIAAAAWIGLARAASVYTVQLLQAGRPGLTLRATETSRAVWRQVRPLMGAGLFIKSSPMVDRYWSSQAGNGAVTVLNLAQLGINSLAVVLERAILVPVSPEFARRLERNDISGLRQAYMRCLRRTAVAVGGMALLLGLLWPVWNDLLLTFLRVPPAAAQQIFVASMLLLPALFSAVGASSAAAVFYAFGETRLPTVIGISGFAASLILKGVLFYAFGILGVAAGGSLYVMLVLLMYHLAVSRRLARALNA